MTYGVNWPISVRQFEYTKTLLLLLLLFYKKFPRISRGIYIFFLSPWSLASISIFNFTWPCSGNLGKKRIFFFSDINNCVVNNLSRFDLKFRKIYIYRFLINNKSNGFAIGKMITNFWSTDIFRFLIIVEERYDDDFYKFNNFLVTAEAITNLEKISKAW